MACQTRVLDREMAAEPSPSLARARHVEHRGREYPAARAPQKQLCRVVGHELLLLLEMSRCRMPSIATRKGWAATSALTPFERLVLELDQQLAGVAEPVAPLDRRHVLLDGGAQARHVARVDGCGERPSGVAARRGQVEATCARFVAPCARGPCQKGLSRR